MRLHIGMDWGIMRYLRDGVLRLNLQECVTAAKIADALACASNCTVCDDGLDGTGSCLGTATDSSDGEL